MSCHWRGLTQILAACHNFPDPADPDNPAKHYSPPLTFIVVRKRHATRLYPSGNAPADSVGNLLAGRAQAEPYLQMLGFAAVGCCGLCQTLGRPECTAVA